MPNTCHNCSAGTLDIPLYQPALHAQKGDVCCTWDSVYSPIWEILGMEDNDSQLFRSFNYSRATFSSLASSGVSSRVTKGRSTPRPCVVLKSDRKGATLISTICLMTTYDATPITQMPYIFQHFSLAVFPNVSPSLRATDGHIHILPPWTNSNQWIIAYPFNSKRTEYRKELRRWRNTHDGRDNFRLGRLAFAQLIERCELNLASWQQLCVADPGFNDRNKAELEVILLKSYGIGTRNTNWSAKTHERELVERERQRVW